MAVAEFSLEGKVAIVTGGSRGIGRSIAIGLAEHGADVAIVARKPEALEEAVDLGGGHVLVFGCAAGDVGIASLFKVA